ncbi:MAG: polysaccharide deacetylase family protein [Thermodesulfobacteriota bacterium]
MPYHVTTFPFSLHRISLTRHKGYPLVVIVALLLFSLGAGAAPTYAVPSHAVIFMYHRFGEERYPSTNIRIDQFEAHLHHLEEEGYRVWSLERIVTYLREGKPIPDRTVAITIDDAYRSVYTNAYPRLRARGWPFTVFVATDPIDRRFTSMMTWKQMREMAKHGVSFANHTTTHDHLLLRKPDESNDTWLERVKGDILKAEKRLEAKLGTAPKLFAYPFGEYDRQLADLVEEMGYVGFGQQSGAAGPYSDLRALPRYPMAEAYSDIDQFSMKAASLALPVTRAEPWDPLIVGRKRPKLEVTLAESDAILDQLTCYVSGQGRVGVVWTDQGERRFTIQAAEPLPRGRSRYNCTAPSKKSKRYYWYSHPWLILDGS